MASHEAVFKGMMERFNQVHSRLEALLVKARTHSKEPYYYTDLYDAIASEYRELVKIFEDLAKFSKGNLEAIQHIRSYVAKLEEKINALFVDPVSNAMLLYEDGVAVSTLDDNGVPQSQTFPAFWVVTNRGGMVRLVIDPELYKQKKDQLVAGQLVIVNDQRGMIISIAPEGLREELMRAGEEVSIDEVLNETDIRIATRMDEKRVVRIPAWFTDEMRKSIRTGEKWVLPVVGPMFLGFGPLPKHDVSEVLLEEVPDVSFAKIGGLGSQIEKIRDAVEWPYLYPAEYKEHDLSAPKGVLLYGPPGCGKTLIAKAIANNLAARISEKKGKKVRGYFMNIKGPELLTKWVGETERKIREIFEQARQKASEDAPVVIFFDEMDALFRTRGAGISSDVESTVVPQLLAEIDGVEALKNVIVVGASNRQDRIDPAVLRPGRLDVKIEVSRPDAAGAFDILSIYLNPGVPLHKKYWDGKPHVYTMPNRLRTLLPEQWKQVDEALRIIHESRGFKRTDLGLQKAYIDTAAAELNIKQLSLTDPERADRARKALTAQTRECYFEEWQIDCEQDAWNMLIYKTVEAVFVDTAPTKAELEKNKQLSLDAGYGCFTREGTYVEFNTRFLEVTYRNGDKEVLFHRDFTSGAALESIHRRAKKYAVKRYIETKHKERGILMVDLWHAVRDEFRESEDLPNTTNPDDWARISGRKGEQIVYVKPLVGQAWKSIYDSGRGAEPVKTGQYL